MQIAPSNTATPGRPRAESESPPGMPGDGVNCGSPIAFPRGFSSSSSAAFEGSMEEGENTDVVVKASGSIGSASLSSPPSFHKLKIPDATSFGRLVGENENGQADEHRHSPALFFSCSDVLPAETPLRERCNEEARVEGGEEDRVAGTTQLRDVRLVDKWLCEFSSPRVDDEAAEEQFDFLELDEAEEERVFPLAL